MKTREMRREKVVKLAQEKGIEIIEMPSGVFWLRGNGIDIRTTDLCYVMPYELMPPKSRGSYA